MRQDLVIICSSEDFSDAIYMCRMLESEGLSCIVSPLSQNALDTLDIVDAYDIIEDSSAIVILFSKHSTHSRWINKILHFICVCEKKCVIPFCIDETPLCLGRVLPNFVNSNQYQWIEGYPNFMTNIHDFREVCIRLFSQNDCSKNYHPTLTIPPNDDNAYPDSYSYFEGQNSSYSNATSGLSKTMQYCCADTSKDEMDDLGDDEMEDLWDDDNDVLCFGSNGSDEGEREMNKKGLDFSDIRESYEFVLPFSNSPHDEACIKDLKITYEKTITCLIRQQEQLKSVQSQIDELKKKKNEIEIQIKNSPSMIANAVGRFLSSIIGDLAVFVGAGAFAGSTTTSSDDAKEKLKECDKELEAKMAQAQVCEKQIEGFIQQKNSLEKELAVLEEQNKYNEVYSSIFAPAEVKRKSHLQVQVYLHLYEESEKVKSLAQESDENAERRDYIPLSLKLKKGDKVDVEFNVYGESRLMSERKSIIWQGTFTKCSFDYFVPKDIDVDELSCEANLFVNGAMIGEMRFISQIVNAPRNLNPEIFSKSFKKIFISYAHKDFDKIKFMAKAYNAQGVDYFFDRDYLKAGDIYPKKIKDYIDTSDLFILCWSKNAAESEYVEKEKSQALSLSKNIDEQKGTLTIHPLSIEPRAELPSDMKDDYNFEVI